VRIVGAGADEVNLRAEPGVNGARLKGLVDGAELELLGEDAEVDGRTWRHVRDPADGAEGWVAAELLGPER
jgi:SH3-like domain-containing protein